MYFTEFSPDPDLAAHVSCYWHMRVDAIEPGHLHEVLPDGCTSVVVSARSSGESRFTIQGPRIAPLMIPIFPGDCFWGARFWPDVGAAALGLEASSVRELLIPAMDVFDESCRPLFERVAECTTPSDAQICFDALLSPGILRQLDLDAVVRAAVLAIVASKGEPAVSGLSISLGLGHRPLQRRFKSAVGLTMKQFARIRRLRSTLQPIMDAPDLRWAAVAAEFGYSDQAHMVREFVALAGLTPTALAERILRIGQGRVNP